LAVLHVLRVFTGEGGRHGNPLGVFLAGAEVATGERQAVAAELGFSETVFVDDPKRGELRIFTPAEELPLAGHPLVGSAWLIAHELRPIDTLRPPAGDVPTWSAHGLTWIRARPDDAPAFELVELDSPAEVDGLDGPPGGAGLAEAWAFVDEPAGIVRARVFAPEVGVEEDEATGSAALRLCAALGRPLEIRQGRGSVLHARPGPSATVEVGGRVVLDETREHPGH
jgi:predicted PhzF superfamily epimerase YddE/YHI9